jgi:hypothetical protein
MIEWDDGKSRANREKHGLAFEDVHLVFRGPTVTFVDDRRDYGEVRYVTMGLLAGRTVVVVHAPRGDTTRIISMFRRRGRGYQTRINRALRLFVQGQAVGRARRRHVARPGGNHCRAAVGASPRKRGAKK